MNGENSGNLEHSNSNRPVISPVIVNLIGSYDRTVDTKSRIGLPYQFRELLGDSPLILLRWLKNSLAIFPKCNWLPLAEAISRLELYTEDGLSVRNLMFANAREVSMDKEGRIIIPQDMLEYANLNGKVIVSGDWDKLTVWNHEYFNKKLAMDDVTFNKHFPSVLAVAKGRKSWEAYELEIAESKSGKNGSDGSA